MLDELAAFGLECRAQNLQGSFHEIFCHLRKHFPLGIREPDALLPHFCSGVAEQQLNVSHIGVQEPLAYVLTFLGGQQLSLILSSVPQSFCIHQWKQCL
jgi:hypothetical protein